MLRSLRDLERYSVHASDGDVGKVVDFFLDDERWGIRYLVVDAGGFLLRRRVLIAPASFREVDWAEHRFHLALTRKAIAGSPDVDTERPVSRQHESQYYDYYGSPPYWSSFGYWNTGANPIEERRPSEIEVHLRSLNEVKGYRVQGTDDSVGHIDDFIVDDQTWDIRYLVVDTGSWWLGKKVLVAPQWATGVSWAERRVHVGLTREAIKASPEWQPGAPINREYEAHLYDSYGRPVYWDRNEIQQSDYLTRHTLLAFLSDEENARVAEVESGPPLADGDEYVDLAHTSRGVRRMHARTEVPMDRVLPRHAVKEKTWSKICQRLGVAVSAAR